MRHALTLALMVTGTAVLADCPTRADLDKGIRFDDSGGESETFKSAGPDRTNSYVDYGNGYGTGYVRLYGHYSVELTDYENGKPIPGGPHVRHSYTPRPKPPRPDRTWVVVSNSRDGADRYEAEETHVMGALRTFTIGACTYKSFPITTTFVELEFTEYETTEYLVDLGIELLIRRLDEAGLDERYTYTAVTALK